MVKGGLSPEQDYLIRPGVKATGVGTALDMGDVVIQQTTTTPDGWVGATGAKSALKAGVNVNRVEDSETEVEVLLKGPARVRAEEAIIANSFVTTGAAKGVRQWVSGTDADNLKKGWFSGLHDNPKTGSPLKQQDPQTIKDAVLNDIIIVDWGTVA